MKATLAVLADAANVSREGKLNILGEFNTIYAAEVPVRWPMMQLVVRLEATAGEDDVHQFGIRVLDEDGKAVAPPVDVPVKFGKSRRRGRPRRAQLIVGIGGARFEKFGTYEFDLLVDAQNVATVSLHVEPRPEPPQLPPVSAPPP